MSASSVFFFLGTITLLLQAWQDYKKQTVDQRRTSFMYGVVITLLLVTKANLLSYFLMIGLAVFLAIITKDYLGKGDKEALYWLLPGIYIAKDALAVLAFLAFFTLFSASLFIANRLTHKAKKDQKKPAFPLLILAFILTAFL